jgi:polyphosphate kinase
MTKTATATRVAPSVSAKRKPTELFTNRELSWLEFNARVLEEALDKRIPLLERVKFLSIFSSNLDEFFMIRVAGLGRQVTRGVLAAPPDGMTPKAQLSAIRERVVPMIEQATRCWRDDLVPKLRDAGIRVLSYRELKSKQRRLLRQHFEREIFPALTPLAFDPGHPFPHISNLSINLALVVNRPGYGESFARLKVPQIFPPLLPVPSEEKAGFYDRLGLEEYASAIFVWIEEVIAENLDVLFPGIDVVASFPFRVTRDADFEIEEDEAADLISALEEVVGQRHFGYAVRLEFDNRIPDRIRDILIQNLELQPYQAYSVVSPVGLAGVMELTKLDRPDLKDPPFLPHVPESLSTDESVFSTLSRSNVLLYHPFDSFNPVVDFVRAAARDPDVVAIKQTLYRVGPDSPIVQALKEARENGKQVAVLVELKARFDETNNIVWARDLEHHGVHVVYGVVGLKTHAKTCLVVRREKDGLKCYVHLGTGNYNPVTARVYTDFGYFTSDPEIAADVSDLFNRLTGYSNKERYRKLLVAPTGMREGILRRIDREIEAHRETGGGRLAFKLNALTDRRCIQAIYRASQAGVKVDLQVRGICCLRPGLPKVSENVRVTSVVGRFLEHTRLFYFRNGGDEEVLFGSADLMPRNLNGRVEVLCPVDDVEIKRSLVEILEVHLADNVRARLLKPNGTYERLAPRPGEPALDSQQWMIEHRTSWHNGDAG